MSAFQIVPTTVEHVRDLAENMRQADKEEVWAASHLSPWGGLVRCISKTPDTYTGMIDGKVLGIGGIAKATLLSVVGCPWLLSSIHVEQHQRAWARYSKYAFQHITTNCGMRHLEGVVDARHTVAVRWIEWMGFKICPAIPFGPDGAEFHPFVWEQ